ncbi:SLAM family member 5-like isoform X2 [Triplophysa dalaica]|uniref:SLAM family member 5-like isoform X2 n=1 Tax=Triplophysa dalaica TaxID=1582913 RepID=UPI0024DF82E0|nr:SLAM family member 5-like isoform X2 [Triplophysa dalaica]
MRIDDKWNGLRRRHFIGRTAKEGLQLLPQTREDPNNLKHADEEEIKSVMEGDSVTLHTDVTHIQRRDQILWMFGAQGIPIADIYNQKPNTYQTGRYGGRLQINSQTGSLTITNMRTTDSGLYRLEVINGKETLFKRFNLNAYARLPVPVIIRNSSQCSSSSERSSVSKCVLLCSVMNVTHVSLSWYKGNSLLSSINVSDLNIRLSLPLEVEYQDNNTYRCVINNPITNCTQHLHINDVCHTCSGLRHTDWVVIIAVIFILISAAGLVCFVKIVAVKHCRINEQELQESNVEETLSLNHLNNLGATSDMVSAPAVSNGVFTCCPCGHIV